MLRPEEIQKQDSLSLCSIYDQWPRHCKEACAIKVDIDYKDVNQIIFTGMGGSATSGEMICQMFSQEKFLQMRVIKDYHLPKSVDNKTLVIASSVSGNTEETLSTLMDAINYGVKIIAISCGGKMENLCKKKGIRHEKIRMLGLPRATLPYLLYVQLSILQKIVGMNDSEALDSIYDMERLSKKVRSSNELELNPSKQLASWMLNGLPACYCSPILRPVANRFKNSLNENAKINAIFDDIIESSHNSIEAWSYKSDITLKPILIPCINDYENIDKRFKILEQFLTSKGQSVYKIPKIGSNIIGSMMCLVYFLDYASIYLALLRKIDPSSTPAIHYVKHCLDARKN